MKSTLQYLLQAAMCMINNHLLVLADPETKHNNKEEAYKYQKIYSRLKGIFDELEKE